MITKPLIVVISAHNLPIQPGIESRPMKLCRVGIKRDLDQLYGQVKSQGFYSHSGKGWCIIIFVQTYLYICIECTIVFTFK